MDVIKSCEYVLAVTESGSISEAAVRLGLAQSALSRYVLKLEKELNTELFDRSSLPITLTQAGAVYCDIGKRMLDLNRQLKKQLDDVRDYHNQVIRVGMGPSRAPVQMPPFLSRFAQTCPTVRVFTEEYRSAELAQRLLEGKLDLAVTFLNKTTAAFEAVPLFDETVYLAVPLRYEEEARSAIRDGAIDIRSLKLPFVSLHEGQQLRLALDILSGGAIRPIYDSDYIESAMALVKYGLGATLVPSYWERLEHDRQIVYFQIRIPDELSEEDARSLQSIIHRRICIFYRKEQFLSQAERAFIAAAQEVCRQLEDAK